MQTAIADCVTNSLMEEPVHLDTHFGGTPDFADANDRFVLTGARLIMRLRVP